MKPVVNPAFLLAPKRGKGGAKAKLSIFRPAYFCDTKKLGEGKEKRFIGKRRREKFAHLPSSTERKKPMRDVTPASTVFKQPVAAGKGAAHQTGAVQAVQGRIKA